MPEPHPSGPPRARVAAAWPLVLAAVAGGCDGAARLAVDLRTDMAPGVEFATVETAVFDGTSVGATAPPRAVVGPIAVADGSPTYDGLRIAELDELPRGDYLVRVQLLDAARAVVAEGRRSVRIDSGAASTVVFVTRGCERGRCPGPGDPPGATGCLAGTCVDPVCPGDPSRCPPPACRADADCAPGRIACAESRCLAGYCVTVTDDSQCAEGRCDLARGCGVAPDAGTPDAGPPDAGVDAGPGCRDVIMSGQNWGLLFQAGDPTWEPRSLTCPATPTGGAAYVSEVVFCNMQPAPYDITLTITDPSDTPLPNPTIWGYAGTVTDPNDCAWTRTGIGAVTPRVRLGAGEVFTFRLGSTDPGATGRMAVNASPF